MEQVGEVESRKWHLSHGHTPTASPHGGRPSLAKCQRSSWLSWLYPKREQQRSPKHATRGSLTNMSAGCLNKGPFFWEDESTGWGDASPA
ncbi:hypothetical protein SKAU_G00089350 [Synaphobranchus kaupii]|uniref:Uncharacterized protein n=1 Tax=Synaphobranchus kaupii TaxID=118154 RepID=A0A9Q1FWI6_SYNKA|nr:hypothetical protein SKAU_G00089350 [Synaphobranchus kaupii]